jgi:hypothetical protein
MRKWFGRPDPAPAFLPFAERPARAAALRDLAEEIAKVWAQGRNAGLLERDESNGLALSLRRCGRARRESKCSGDSATRT